MDFFIYLLLVLFMLVLAAVAAVFVTIFVIAIREAFRMYARQCQSGGEADIDDATV